MTTKYKKLALKPAVLVEQVAQSLMDAILKGVFSGGDQLKETELQKQFGISRSPLRESFRELEKRGLVTIIPRRGTFVKTITLQDIEENFPTRATLEGLAAKEAYANISSEELSSLRKAFSKMEAAATQNDAKKYRKYHLQFHELFIHASKNNLLIDIVSNLRLHTLWHRFSYRYYKDHPEHSLGVHKKIIEMFETADTNPDELERVVRHHIEDAAEDFVTYFCKENESLKTETD